MTPLSGGEREELPDIVIEDFSDCVVVTLACAESADTMRTQNIRVERGTKVRLRQTIDFSTSHSSIFVSGFWLVPDLPRPGSLH